MNHADQAYGDLIRIDPAVNGSAEVLQRVPLGTPVAEGGIDESSLHDLLFEFPDTLPLGAIDVAFAHPVPVCRELSTRAGYVDAVYVNALGRLVLAEFKLWRNPQARREVIGQILDYAKEFASWSYEDLQREVSRSLARKGNVLYELVRTKAPNPRRGQLRRQRQPSSRPRRVSAPDHRRRHSRRRGEHCGLRPALQRTPLQPRLG